MVSAKAIAEDGTASGANVYVSGLANVTRILCSGLSSSALKRFNSVVDSVTHRLEVTVDPSWLAGYEAPREPVDDDEESDTENVGQTVTGQEEVLADFMRHIEQTRPEFMLTCRYRVFWNKNSRSEDAPDTKDWPFCFSISALRYGKAKDPEQGSGGEKETISLPYLNLDCVSVEAVDVATQIAELLSRNKSSRKRKLSE